MVNCQMILMNKMFHSTLQCQDSKAWFTLIGQPTLCHVVPYSPAIKKLLKTAQITCNKRKEFLIMKLIINETVKENHGNKAPWE